MRKLICENKGADHLEGNGTADQRLCFRYIDTKIVSKPKIVNPLAISCGCAARVVLDLVENPERQVFS